MDSHLLIRSSSDPTGPSIAIGAPVTADSSIHIYGTEAALFPAMKNKYTVIVIVHDAEGKETFRNEATTEQEPTAPPVYHFNAVVVSAQKALGEAHRFLVPDPKPEDVDEVRAEPAVPRVEEGKDE